MLNATAGAPLVLPFARPSSDPAQSESVEAVWEFDTDEDFVRSSPTVVRDTVYVGGSDSHVYALNAQSGYEQWSVEAGDGVSSSPNVVGGTVYVGSNDGTLLAIDAASGDRQWEFAMKKGIGASPTVSDGTAYCGDDNGVLVAVDAETSDLEWTFETGGPILSSPTVVDDTVYVGSDDGNCYALNAADGSERWRFENDGVVRSSPTVLDGVVYVGLWQPFQDTDAEEGLYALNADTGEEEWVFAPDHAEALSPGVSASPTVRDGTVYVGAMDNHVYAIDTSEGSEQWRFETEDWVSMSSPTVAGEAVYVGSDDGNCYALDATDGSERWRFETDSGFDSSPTVVEGVVYLGGMDGTVYALDGGVDASSEGSRVALGTLGHHHRWAGETPGREGLVEAPIRGGPLDLGDVDLAKDRAAPFEFVEVTGVPEGIEPQRLHAEYRTAASSDPIGPDDAAPMALLASPNDIASYDGRQGIYLHTPVPDPDGSRLRVKITDGESYSGAIELEVDPLPGAATASGAFEEYVSALRSLLATTTEAYGLEYPADLQAFHDDPETMDPVYTGLLRAYDALDNPDNEASLANRDPDSEAVIELERVLVHTRIPEQIQGLADFAGSDETLIDEAVAALESTDADARRQQVQSGSDTQAPASMGQRDDLTAPSSSRADRPVFEPLANAEGDDVSSATASGELPPTVPLSSHSANRTVFEPLYEIGGPGELSDMMKSYHEKAGRLEIVQQVEETVGNLQSMVGLTSAASDMGTTSNGSSSRGGSSKADKLEAILTGVSIGIGLSTFILGFYPCCITDTRIRNPIPDVVELEAEDVSEPQAEIRVVRVDARSDADAAGDLLDQVVGAVGDAVSGQITDRLPESLTDFEETVGEEVTSYGTGEAFGLLELNHDLYFEWTGIDLLGDLAKSFTVEELLTTAGPEIWTIVSPDSWGPQSTLSYELDPQTFFGNERAVNHVFVRPHPENFPPGGHPAGRLTLLARTIVVDFPRSVRQIEAGESYEIDFHIKNSVLEEDPPYKDVELDPGHGEIERPPTEVDDGHYRITYHAPETVGEDFEEHIRVTAHSEQGVRQHRGHVIDRVGTATLTTEGPRLQLSETGCTEPDETASLTAIVQPADETLSWEASAGTLDVAADTHSAVLTPGEDTGDVTVTVTAEESGEVATTTVPVRPDCPCGAEIYTGLGDLEVIDEAKFGWKANAVLTSLPRFGGMLFPIDEPGDYSMKHALWAIDSGANRESGTYPGGASLLQPGSGVTVTSDNTNGRPSVFIEWKDRWSPVITFSHRAIYTKGLGTTAPDVGKTYISGTIRPRVVEPAGSIGARNFKVAPGTIDPRLENIVDHGDYFEDPTTGVRWSNCTREICQYTNDAGMVGARELRDALADWRQGNTDRDVVRNVASELGSDEPVRGCGDQ